MTFSALGLSEELVRAVTERGYTEPTPVQAQAIHAVLSGGDLQVLVATDIAARGIDIIELPHVVNFELPNVAEDYVHRIGRTGRAGSEGEASSLVCVDEHKLLRDIERLTKRGFAVPRFSLVSSCFLTPELNYS